jgi:hypothetical protein
MPKAKFQKIADDHYKSYCPCGRVHVIYAEDGDVVCDIIEPKQEDTPPPSPSDSSHGGLPKLFSHSKKG